MNDFRLSHGKAPLGFLNPLIYSKGVAGFNDITSGSNPGCGTNGFPAGAGWDPVSGSADFVGIRWRISFGETCSSDVLSLQVTGLGTPDFGKLKELLG